MLSGNIVVRKKQNNIENQCRAENWDIFNAAYNSNLSKPENILDDIGDLRRYLILVEEEIMSHTERDATPTYVDQVR